MLCCSSSSIVAFILSAGSDENDDPAVGPSPGPSAGPSVGPSAGPSAEPAPAEPAPAEPAPSGPSSSEIGDAALAAWEAGAAGREAEAAAAAKAEEDGNAAAEKAAADRRAAEREAADKAKAAAALAAALAAEKEAQRKSYEEGLKTNDAGEKASQPDAHPSHNWSAPSMKKKYSTFGACWSDANSVGGGSWVSKFKCCETKYAPNPQRSDGVGWHFCYENT